MSDDQIFRSGEAAAYLSAQTGLSRDQLFKVNQAALTRRRRSSHSFPA